jgi:hypothetical protein
MPPIPMAAVLPGVRALTGPISRTLSQECIPAPSVGSATEGMREPTHSKDDPVSVASMEGAAVASMVEAATAAGATDSSCEVIKP